MADETCGATGLKPTTAIDMVDTADDSNLSRAIRAAIKAELPDLKHAGVTSLRITEDTEESLRAAGVSESRIPNLVGRVTIRYTGGNTEEANQSIDDIAALLEAQQFYGQVLAAKRCPGAPAYFTVNAPASRR